MTNRSLKLVIATQPEKQTGKVGEAMKIAVAKVKS